MYAGIDCGPALARVAVALETLSGTTASTAAENAGARIAAALESIAAITEPAAQSQIGRICNALDVLASNPALLNGL